MCDVGIAIGIQMARLWVLQWKDVWLDENSLCMYNGCPWHQLSEKKERAPKQRAACRQRQKQVVGDV